MCTVDEVERNARSLIQNALPSLVNADAHPDDDRQMVQSVFLGTVFSIMPSGKYYMPWACSNVEPCEECKGEGWKGMTTCEYCNGKAYRTIKEEVARLNTWRSGSDHIWFGDQETEESLIANKPSDCPILNMPEGQSFPCSCYGGEVHETCEHCDGLGSREAYLDEMFRDAMEDEASKNDSWVENGEGDPCDLFLCRIVD